MGNIEQTKPESDAHSAAVPSAGNEPPGQHTNSSNTTGTSGNEHRPREPHEKRIREWLIVLFTGTIVVGTLFYASIAKRQADLMSQQRDVMIRQVNASQRQIEEMKTQTNTFNETLGEARKGANAAVNSADSGQRSATAAEQGVQTSAQSMIYGEAAYITIQAGTVADFALNSPAAASVSFTNSGQTPAYDVTFRGYMEVRNKPIPVPMPFPPLNRKEEESRGILPPNNPVTHIFVSRALNAYDLVLLNSQQYRLYVWGRVKYRDIFRRNRWLKFCLVHKLGLDKFVPCENNNEAN